jgi:hypothetical protein
MLMTRVEELEEEVDTEREVSGAARRRGETVEQQLVNTEREVCWENRTRARSRSARFVSGEQQWISVWLPAGASVLRTCIMLTRLPMRLLSSRCL